MFKNIFYNTYKNEINLWEQIDGENSYTQIPWVPYVYEGTNDDTHIQTIDGRYVGKKRFDTYNDYYTYCKDNSNIFENKVRPEIQFLSERYNKIPDDKMEVPKLLIYSFDIEVVSHNFFPSVQKAEAPVTAISIKNSITGKTISFGTKKYTGLDAITYIYCDSEELLLQKFFKYTNAYPCDILTGWNIWYFDIPYLINRCKVLFGEKTNIYKGFSPIKVVKTWKQKNSEDINIDIAGVTILDYYTIYKWYAPVKLESYSLEYVCMHELGEGKIDYSEHVDLNTLYDNDFNKYIEYNARDCHLVDKLENKLGYIKLIQALSLLTKCTMKYYDVMTQLIEGSMLTYYRRNNLCAPFFAGGYQEDFEAAYVKEPDIGMHEWVVDIDIASSYPSHIITLNMSLETYFGRILGINEGQIIYYTKTRSFPKFKMMKETSGVIDFEGKRLQNFNKALERGLLAIAPCGSVFNTKIPGVIAIVERNVYNKRLAVKEEIKKLKTTAIPNLKGKEKQRAKERAEELFSLQWAIKIILNAVFGVTSVPYSRYFNVNIAEAITSCGRHTIKQGEKFVNEFFEKDNMVAYIDTDSLFIKLGDYMKEEYKDWVDWNDDKKIKYILSKSKEIEEHVNMRVFEEVQRQDYNSQVTDFKIEFKQEIVAKRALFVKKKKYAYWCVNEEGFPVDKLSVTGLEVVRSDSGIAARKKIKDVMEMIMRDKSDDDIIDMISKCKKELQKVKPEDIAANITTNNIDKYVNEKNETIKGTPWHIKGIANYRMLLDKLNLKSKYEDINEGTKSKVLYVKKNPYNIETITFTEWPKEFNEILTIDYDTMLEKFFINKIKMLLTPMKKESMLDDNRKNLGMFFK